MFVVVLSSGRFVVEWRRRSTTLSALRQQLRSASRSTDTSVSAHTCVYDNLLLCGSSRWFASSPPPQWTLSSATLRSSETNKRGKRRNKNTSERKGWEGGHRGTEEKNIRDTRWRKDGPTRISGPSLCASETFCLHSHNLFLHLEHAIQVTFEITSSHLLLYVNFHLLPCSCPSQPFLSLSLPFCLSKFGRSAVRIYRIA